MINVIFWIWYSIGLVLMLFFHVPDALKFSNGLFLFFFAIYALKLEKEHTGQYKKLIPLALVVGAITFTIEAVGVWTGIPFGQYAYSSILGIGAFGVPFAIACAWVGVLINALLISNTHSKWSRAIEVGIWVVLFDLVLDPVAYARGFWIWESKSAYFGIPVENFISWFLIAALLSLVFPLKPMAEGLRRKGTILFQAMLLMFGLLGLKEGMTGVFFLSVVLVLVAEGRILLDRSRQKTFISNRFS
ncbi:carotenoid biosynthesis protein [Pseudalkalibacillus sp. Hm43]|uniref:carotenoid biosynthesis protein n=1 Tax=Pseudalkalibacillus sp. Hm43 TaxID=3450742 RepID=UPI003F430B4F